ncbi:hypothetical protein P43SY_010109 [Pythium insidiosum]|uniref:PA14 domain-containing protein n=1 Tax=Pythium insidiosum TaxID=114742 RepID=A0AAD5LW99_PYTIN|nr:hypothetical protein P43SY_010109 [Pythium insidiosum]
MPSIDQVVVTRDALDVSAESLSRVPAQGVVLSTLVQWTVTFSTHSGDVPPLVADSSGLRWQDDGQLAPRVVIDEYVRGTLGNNRSVTATTDISVALTTVREDPGVQEVQVLSCRGSSAFTLSFGGQQVVVPPDASLLELEAALNTIVASGIRVYRFGDGAAAADIETARQQYVPVCSLANVTEIAMVFEAPADVALIAWSATTNDVAIVEATKGAALQETPVTISNRETQQLSCLVAPGVDPAQTSFTLQLTDDPASALSVAANTAIAAFASALNALPAVAALGGVDVTSTQPQVCLVDTGGSTPAPVSLAFRAVGDPPTFQVTQQRDGIASLAVVETVKGLSAIAYSQTTPGRFVVTARPQVKGVYAFSAQVLGVETFHPPTVVVHPSLADADQSEHDAPSVLTQGVARRFQLQAIDRFANALDGSTELGVDGWVLELQGPANASARGPTRSLAVSEAQPNTNGRFDVELAANEAGDYVLSLWRRQAGGLWGTYYRTSDFSGALTTRRDASLNFTWAETAPLGVSFPNRDYSVEWRGEIRPPTTGSYVFTVSSDDAVSLAIDGVDRIDTFAAAASAARNDSVSSPALALTAGRFYTLHVRYRTKDAGARLRLEWSCSGAFARSVVPSTALFSRAPMQRSPLPVRVYPGAMHPAQTLNSLDGFRLVSAPAMNATTTALQTFVLELETRDAVANTRDQDGSTAFQVSLVGVDGWAAVGRNNDVVSGAPETIDATTVCAACVTALAGDTLTVSADVLRHVVAGTTFRVPDANSGTLARRRDCFFTSVATTPFAGGAATLTVAPNHGCEGFAGASRALSLVWPRGWRYVGTCSVLRQRASLSGCSADLRTLPADDPIKRGDVLVVGRERHVVDPSRGVLDATNVPLSAPYLGASQDLVPVFKAAAGLTGRHRVSFVPYVKGTYELSVRVPQVHSVQAVRTVADTALDGTFKLGLRREATGLPAVTPAIPFDASAAAMQAAIETLPGIAPGSLQVTRTCGRSGSNDATQGCRWVVTFTQALATLSDVLLAPVAGTSLTLTGNGARVLVDELTVGRPATMVAGFPRRIFVRPGPTNPSVSVALGRGLYGATAGQLAHFVVQLKDTHGNDREDVDARDLVRVQVFPAAARSRGTTAASTPETSYLVKGNVSYVGNGRYNVTYEPVKSGLHTVSIVVQTTAELHQVSTTFGQLRDRGGTFALRFRGATTDPLAWNAGADDVQQALLALPSLQGPSGTAPTLTVTRQANVATSGFDYWVSYDALPSGVELELLGVVNNLYGANGRATITAQVVTRQQAQHIKTSANLGTPIVNEVQVVRISTSGTALTGGTFVLGFDGLATTPIAWNADAATLQSALEALPSIGAGGVQVSKPAAPLDALGSNEWTVSFVGAASAGTPQVEFWSSNRYTRDRVTTNERLVGDLPALDVVSSAVVGGTTPRVVVLAGRLTTSPGGVACVDGIAPFSTLVAHGAIVPERCTAVDTPTPFWPGSVQSVGLEGLHRGTFHSKTSFVIETRDVNGNLLDGTGYLTGALGGGAPQSEVQVFETKIQGAGLGATLQGTFSLLFGSQKTAPLPFNAGIKDVEAELERLVALGAVSVTTNDVTTAVELGTVVATRTSDVLQTGAVDMRGEFSVGDWIRVGAVDGPVFSVTATTASSLSLSSPYYGASSAAATVYKQTPARRAAGFTYIVVFDSDLGDLPALSVDSSQLRVSNNVGTVQAAVTACDGYRVQEIRTSSDSQLAGTFSLEFRGETTAMLPWNVGAAALSDAVEALSTIHTATVDHPPTGGLNGGFTWRVTLTSVEQDGEELLAADRLQTNDQALLYAEGYLLVGANAKIAVTPVCPTASTAGGAWTSQRGQLGHTFVPVLSGADSVPADVTYQGPGTYVATYDTPRAASYSLEVRHARPRGLQAAYFSNRWLYGSPDVERVDTRLDFEWPSLITPSSQDYVSARWTGYVKPAFSEDYVFYVRVNDGARLWIQDTLVLDAFENEVPTGIKTMEFASNVTALVAGRLTPIVLEYRELTGYAGLQVLWASRTQDKAVISSERLFYRSSTIYSSPFGVQTIGVKPTAPTAVQLSIAAWDALTVAFNAPVDDGGAAVDSYLVEWWTTGTYGSPEVQVVKIANGNLGGTFTLELDNGAITGPLAWNALYSDVEAALEALDAAGDVQVTSSTASGVTRDYTITFSSRVGAVPTLRVNGAKLTGTGVFGSSASTVNILGSSTQVSLDIRRGDPYRFTIRGLVQPAATVAPATPGLGGAGGPGFDVRVTAHTAAGYGLPSAPVSLKPMAVPAAPENVVLRLVAGSSTSLRVAWDAPLVDNSARVTHYVVEWGPWQDPSLGLQPQLTSFRETTAFFLNAYPTSLRYKHTIPNLSPGQAYVVTVRAENVMGVGPAGLTVPSMEVPRSKATPLIEGIGGVSLSVRPADNSAGVSVTTSASTLRLAWLAPSSVNGAAVSRYVVEWFSAAERPEVQILKIAGQDNADVVTGTFQVSYGAATTDALPIDVTELDLETSLRALSTLRDVHVERSPARISGGYEWTVTFHSESPAVAGRTLQLVTTELKATALATDVGAALNPGRVGAKSKAGLAATNGQSDVTATGIEADAVVGMYLTFTTSSAGAAVSGLGPWRVVAVATNKVTLETAFTGATDTYSGVLGWTVPSALPTNYRTTTVDATTFTLDLTGLTAGSAVTARVSACNSLGCNAPRLSTPSALAPPRQKPAEPRQVQLSTESATALRVTWSHPSSDGGAVVTHYRIEWDTAAAFDSAALASDVRYIANPGVDCVFTPCAAVLGALKQGTPYYVRVFAYNAFGYSVLPGLALPPFAVPKTQPTPPSQVQLSPVSVPGGGPARLAVAFDMAHDNGGAETTQYRIEWDAQSLDAIVDRAVVSLAAASALADDVLYSRHTTQLLLLSATAYDVRGTFRVAFRGHATAALPWDVSAEALGAALEALEPTGKVDVRRVATGNGFAWFVRFLTQQVLPPGTPGGGGLPALVVSLDSTELVSAFSTSKTAAAGGASATLLGTGAKLETTTVIKAWNGFELQTVSVSASVGTLGGSFQLLYDNKKTPSLPWNASERAVETELQALGSGEVRVLKQALSTASGFQFLVLFLTRLGPNQPILTCDRTGLTSTSNGAAFTCDVVRQSPGVRPVMNSPLYGSVVVETAALRSADSSSTMARYEIPGLTVGAAYHVRVSAWNGVGNVFGSSRFSTPALVVAQTRPDGPKDLRVAAVSDTAVLATWTPPLNAGGVAVSRFDLQLDATTGVAEQQTIQVVSQWSDLDGFFTLRAGVDRSAPIAWDASADGVLAALQALPSLQLVIAGVSRRRIALGGIGFEWTVTFTPAAGDVALLSADGSALRGTDSAVTVRELVQGQRKRFASPTLTSLAVRPRPEVQEVLLFSASRIDLRGTVTLSFCGATTPPIAFDASSETIRQALEGLSTLSGPVDVSTQPVLQRQPTRTRQRYGVQWLVTFSGLADDDVPLLLVSTSTAPTVPVDSFRALACGGTLLGSSPCVRVRELVPGGLVTQALLSRPTSSATTLSAATSYDLRVATVNQAAFSSDWVSGATSIAPQRATPSAPRRVEVTPLGSTALGVSWHAPRFAGGLPVTQYSVQWDVTTAFDQQSVFAGSLTVAASASTGTTRELEFPGDADASATATFATVLSGLDSAQQYVVRVLAYNALGYGDASAVASVVDASTRVSRLVVRAANLATALTAPVQTVKLSFGNYAATTTSSLSVNALAASVQNALHALPMVGVVSVARDDHSSGPAATPFDASGVSTPTSYRVEFTITFVAASRDGIAPAALGPLQVALDAAPAGALTAADLQVYEVRADGSSSTLVAPQPMPSLGPTDVRVSVVDATSLGVRWRAPVSASAAATKYLLEWSDTRDFAKAKATPDGGGVAYSTASSFTQVVAAANVPVQSYTITGLATATPYFVRVSAFNGDLAAAPDKHWAYSAPVLAAVVLSDDDSVVADAESLAPAAQRPFRPTTVTMRVSTRDIPSQLEVLFTEPTLNALGFLGRDGGSTITHYRVAWATDAAFKTARSYDVRMVTADPLNPVRSCSAAACMFPLGATVQSLALSPNANAGTFRLALGGGTNANVGFTRQLCAACALTFDAAATQAFIDFTLPPDLRATLGTNAYLVVDKAGAQCLYQVAAVAPGVPATRLPVLPVSAAGVANARCSLANGAYSVHVRPQSASCLSAPALTATDLETALETMLGDDVTVSLDPTVGRVFRVTFTGPTLALSSAALETLQVTALDGSAGCTALPAGANVWTAMELSGRDVVTPGVPYFVQVSAISAVGTSLPQPATPVCHDAPCDAVKLAPASPPSAPASASVWSDRADRTSLRVRWTAPTTTNGASVRAFLVEYSVDAFTRVAICAGCATALSGTTLTLSSNVALANGRLIALSSVVPECLVTVVQVQTAWNGASVQYQLQGFHGCDDFSAQSVNVDGLHDTGSGFVVVTPEAAEVTGDPSTFATALTSVLTANTAYSVRVRAQNNEGIGAATAATPVCESGIEACVAAPVGGSPLVIVTRQLPSAPSVAVPLQLRTLGSANELGFTKDSLGISFADPNEWTGLEAVDWFRVEWDTVAAMTSTGKRTALVPVTASGATALGGGAVVQPPSIWTQRQLCAACVTALDVTSQTLTLAVATPAVVVRVGDALTIDLGQRNCLVTVATVVSPTAVTVTGDHTCAPFAAQTLALHRRNAFPFQLSALAMGVPIFVRVTAHNSLGYGPASDAVRLTPITSSDPPPAPDVTLSVLPPSESADPAARVSSLVVRFLPPQIKAPTDLNGDGGAAISKYLVEWSDADWATGYVSHVQVISTASSGAGALSGSFRLALDTTGCTTCQVRGVYSTSAIAFDATALAMTTLLQNLPNVGQVTVTRGACSVRSECTWQVTFVSELGAIPSFTVLENRLSADLAVASITISSLPASGGRTGSLQASLYCPTTPAGGGAVVSGPTNCGVVEVSPAATTPLPLRFVISGLTPGGTYFVRVSAFHDLGFGLRRISAPASLRVPFDPPTTPSSLFNPLAPPVLWLSGPTSLDVAFGPPAFSGGSPVTAYAIAWDTQPSFESGANGDPLGEAVVAAGANGAGGRYRITGLATATWYYVRVYALNAEMGGGLPVTTTPAREMPRGKPGPPQSVTVRNNLALAPAGSSLTVRWAPPGDLGTATPLAAVTSYRVEWFQRAPSDPFFGRSPVQLVETRGSLSGGTFTLALGDWQSDAASLASWRVLPGAVDVVNGQAFVRTSADLTGLLAAGDLVAIDGQQYVVSRTGTFSSTQLPLASAADHAAATTATIGATAATYSGVTKTAIPIRTPWKTTPLPIDCPPDDLRAALELLPSVGRVHVERFQVGNAADNNFNWFVTFSTQVPSPGALPTLVVNDRQLVGTGAVDAGVSVPQVGQAPPAYGFALVSAPPGATLEYNVSQLATGVPYFVRVAAINDRGLGDFATARVVRRDGSLEPDLSVGLAATRPPLALENARLTVRSPSSIELQFDQVAASGGLAVDGYRVQFDTTTTFTGASLQTLELPPATTFHRVTTGAHTGPFLAGSTFTLATVDDRSFRGAFSQQVDAYVAVTTVITVGAGFVTRIVPDALKGYGTADLGATFSRGEPLLLRNNEVSVCLDRAVSYVLPGITTASFDGTSSVLTVTTLPANLLSLVLVTSMISVGIASMPVCVATVSQVVSASQLELTHNCAVGLLNLPGQAVNLHWGPAVLPLCAAGDPWSRLDTATLTAWVTTDPVPLKRVDTVVGVAQDLLTAGPGSDQISVVQPVALACGDVVRLGSATQGPRYRVRAKCDLANTCNCAMATATGALQLGSMADSSAAVSLSGDALAMATREIQTLRFETATGDLTQGVGGFRLQFGNEISSRSLRGGNGGANLNDDIGCLLWSSGSASADAARDVLDIEAEIEAFLAVDDVRVTRTLSTGPTVLIYTVEFIGVQVRGKLPALQIVDVGSNGCSAFAGATLLAPTVTKAQLARATIYRAPTTVAIPFDAADVDVKAALQQLSSVSLVDVSRDVAKHGFSWRVTYVSFSGADRDSPPSIVANGLGLAAIQDPFISVTQFQELQLNTQLLGATSGVSVFARVFARNANGYGDETRPVPAALQPAAQLPGSVRRPRVDVVSDSELLVQWDYPRFDGGEPVSEYKIEWWRASAPATKGSQVVHQLESPGGVVDVQTISISAPVLGPNVFLGGTFQVAFDGVWSDELPYDTSAIRMQQVLRNLSTIEGGDSSDAVSVSRVLSTNGYTWLVTFNGQKRYAGSQHHLRLSTLDAMSSHRLAVSGRNLLVCTTAQRSVCVPRLDNAIRASVSIGTTQEIQTLTCTGTPGATTFVLNVLGVATAAIRSDATLTALESAIESVYVGGSVSISFQDAAAATAAGQTTICATTNPVAVLIQFDTARGDIPLLATSNVAVGLTVAVAEIRKGRPQRVVGRLPYSYLITGLAPGELYTVRVAAYNSIGYGPFSVARHAALASGGAIVPATRVPTPPQSLSVRSRLSSSSLLVVWEAPQSTGGSAITSYRVEWDVTPSFTSVCGERSEVQYVTLSHTALPAANAKYKLMLGSTVIDCVDWQETAANLETKIRGLGGIYSGAKVTSFGDDTARWDFGHTYKVVFENAVTATTSAFPLQIPLLAGDKTDNTCNSFPGVISVARERFGPGQDAKQAQGKIDSANNECLSSLQEGVGRQTLDDLSARTNALSAPALQLALTTLAAPLSPDGADVDRVVMGANARVLCTTCVQKLTGNQLTVTTDLTTTTLVAGDYVIVEEVLAPGARPLTPATVGRKCVLKTTVVAASAITIDPTDAAFTGGTGPGCQLPVPFDSQAWQLKLFNLKAFTVTDLVPGREYAVRVVAINARGESEAAVV